MYRKRFKIGLALGGGGARGLAHVGVIRILEKEGIPIDIIVGTSAGSVVGAYYALWKNSQELKTIAIKIANKLNQYSKYFDFNKYQAEGDRKQKLPWRRLTEFIRKGYFLHTELNKVCLNDGMYMEKVLGEIFSEYSFHETKIPFRAIAADLISGKETVLNEGRLTKAIMASCAIPGIFPPVQYNNQLLVDGGIIDNVPVEPVKKAGTDFVIASDINRDIKRKNKYNNAIDILIRSDLITSKALRRIQLEKSDFVISPEINHIDWWDFSKPEICIELGEEAARRTVNKLKSMLRKNKLKNSWKKLIIKH
ncbi:MAG: patatin-like phospholipase family protein [Candidatus Caldatribacteriota bacterium]